MKFQIVAVALVALAAVSIPLATAGGPTGNDITIAGLTFIPTNPVVAAGAAIKISNSDVAAHTVTSDTGAFDSGFIDAGGSASIHGLAAGTYQYHCIIHFWMHGVLVVQ